MNTAVVRGGIVNVPVLLWNFEVRTTGSCESACIGMQQQRLLPERGIGEGLRLRRGIHQHHGFVRRGKQNLSVFAMRSTMSPGTWSGPTL